MERLLESELSQAEFNLCDPSGMGLGLKKIAHQKPPKPRGKLYPEPSQDPVVKQRKIVMKAVLAGRNPTLWRTSMGEYIPAIGCGPLTSLALPLPAPTNYMPKYHLVKPNPPGFTIPNRPKRNDTTIGPGPAGYDIQWGKKSKKPELFTMPLHCSHYQADQVSPGPNAYNTQQHKGTGKDGPKFSIGLKVKVPGGHPSRLIKPIDTPGFRAQPNLYKQNNYLWKQRGAEFSFQGKHKVNVFTTPAPNRYHVEKETKRPPKYTMSVRHCKSYFEPTSDQTNHPAPNNYILPSTLKLEPGKSLYSRREVRSLEERPDVFSYVIPREIKEGGHQMTYRPFDPLNPPRHPAPNQYFLKQTSLYGHVTHKPGCTLKSRLPKPYTEITPAPGDYEIPRPVGNERAGYMGLRSEKESQDLPGPDAYMTDNYSQIRKKKEPAYTFGLAHKKAMPTTPSPGPATYTTYRTERGPAYTMRVKIMPKKPTDKVPGPASYKLNPACNKNGVKKPVGATLKSRATPFLYTGLTERH